VLATCSSPPFSSQIADDCKKVRDQIRQVKAAAAQLDDVNGAQSEAVAINKEEMLAEIKGRFGKELVAETLERLAVGDSDTQPPHQVDQTTVKLPIGKLTEANLSRRESAKPAWARTEEENGAAEEDEVEDLLEFAENLDIDKYMDDYEFNEALAAAKARITELDEELGEEGAMEDADEVMTQRTGMSQGSMMSERLREKAAQQEAKDDAWDNGTNPEGEGRVTSRSRASRAIAEEMLEMNPVRTQRERE